MPNDEIASWNAFYMDHDVAVVPDVRYVRYFKHKLVRGKTATVLDIGCGNGRHTVALAKMGYKVVAVDYSAVALKLLSDTLIKERVRNLVSSFQCDLKNPVQVAQMVASREADCCLVFGVLDYFNDDEVVNLLIMLRGACKTGAKLLIAAWGEKNFCHDSPLRADAWMTVHKRSMEDWTALLGTQNAWGGNVLMDSRLETFQNIPVGGVSGTMLKEHWIFIEAEAV